MSIKSAIIIAGLLVAVAIAAAAIDARDSDRSTAPTPLAARTAVALPDEASGVAREIIDQKSLQARGSFNVRRGSVSIYTARPREASAENDERLCLVVIGRGSAGVGCSRAEPFETSQVMHAQFASGGPDPASRTSYELAGFASERVGRVVAVDTRGVEHAVRTSPGRAFLVELPPEVVRAGVEFAELHVYDHQGGLLEEARVQR